MRTMDKFFLSIDEAKKFANEQHCESIEVNKWTEQEYHKYSMFNIEGYSEVVRAYHFRQYTRGIEQEKYWSYEGYFWVLRIIETGQLLCMREISRDKFFIFPLIKQYDKRDRGFKYNEPEPNYIGKATQKKIQQWVDYCNAKEKARIEFANDVLQKNIEFADKFRAKFPQADFETQYDGWTSKISFYLDYLYIKYIALENGSFSREVQVVYSKVPTTEDLLK